MWTKCADINDKLAAGVYFLIMSNLFYLPLLSCSKLHNYLHANALTHLAMSWPSPSPSPIITFATPSPLYKHTHTCALWFIPTLLCHCRSLRSLITLCHSQSPALVSPLRHETYKMDKSPQRGRCVWVHEAAPPPAGGMGKAHPRVLQPPHERETQELNLQLTVDLLLSMQKTLSAFKLWFTGCSH